MNEIDRWMRDGAGAEEGLRLLGVYAPNPYLDRMVRRDPARYGRLLARALSPLADGDVSGTVIRKYPAFRERWPFLSDPGCPMELKALAADMITAWHAYVAAHEELYSCSTMEECYATAKKVVENYTKNRKILSEFEWYKEHGRVLGKHPAFAEARRLKELRGLGAVELVRRRKRLADALWRLRRDIRRGDRPDLDAERGVLIEQKERLLSEVDSMIADISDR